MKNLKGLLYPLIFVVLAVCLTSTVFAAASFSMNDMVFGSSSQVRNQNVNQVLHIVNDGTVSLDITLSTTIPSIYNVHFSQSTVTIGPNSSVDVTVTSLIPLSQSSTQTDFISGITATATNVAGISRTSKVSYSAISMLEIYKVLVDINGDERSLRRGDVYSNDIIKAGAPVKFTVYVRNNFDSVDNIDINDINLDMRSSGSLDLDESDSMNDLQYGDKDQVSFSTTIPTDAEDGDTYGISVRVTGKDQNGASHTDTYNAQIEVKRPAHEITIKNIVLSPQNIVCNAKATLNVDLKNTGRSNEDKVHLIIRNDDLGIDQRFYEMSIDKDDTLKKTYSFNIANTTAPGQYDILLTSLYDTNTESDTQVATLTVSPCPTNTQSNSNAQSGTNANNNVQTQPTIPQVVPTNGATPVYGSASFTDSPIYLIILVAAVIIILAILIILLVKFVF